VNTLEKMEELYMTQQIFDYTEDNWVCVHGEWIPLSHFMKLYGDSVNESTDKD
jgi:hypothetical protein